MDNMAQIVAIEPSNKMCRHIFNCREPDLCLLTSCQLCPPKLPFVVPPLLNCIFNCLLAQWGSVSLDQGPVHSYPTLPSSRKVIQPTFVVGHTNFIARFLCQFGHCREKGLRIGVPNQRLFEGGWAMMGEDNYPHPPPPPPGDIRPLK